MMSIKDKYIAAAQQILEQQKHINALQKDLRDLNELHDAWRERYFRIKEQRDSLIHEFCVDLVDK